MTKRIVVELDVTLQDETWTDQTLLENLPDYLIIAISRAEQASTRHPEPTPYVCNVDDLTVWLSREDYVADLQEGESRDNHVLRQPMWAGGRTSDASRRTWVHRHPRSGQQAPGGGFLVRRQRVLRQGLPR